MKIGTTQVQKKLFYKMGKIKNLTHGENREQEVRELAQELNVRCSDIEEMQQRFSGKDLSLDSKLEHDQDASFLEFLPDTSPDQEVILGDREEHEVRRDTVTQALERLSGREQFIIRQRIMTDEPMTLQEVGDTFCISRERVRQIEADALRKLRSELSVTQLDCGQA